MSMRGTTVRKSLDSAARRGLAVALPLLLLGCNSNSPDRNIDSLDEELADRNNAANVRDPAVVSALQDQIMVDPQLVGQANNDAIRPPGKPYAAPVPPDSTVAGRGPVKTGQVREAPAADKSRGCPSCKRADGSLTLGALAARQADRRTSGCAARVSYSTGWANRLPAAVPLYPDARVVEAAGADGGGCALRVVSFATRAAPKAVIDWYYTRTSDAGFAAARETDGKQDVLGGTRNRDGGAFVVYVSRRADGGSDVDLIANNGS